VGRVTERLKEGLVLFQGAYFVRRTFVKPDVIIRSPMPVVVNVCWVPAALYLVTVLVPGFET
jgi:hypothetical protein